MDPNFFAHYAEMYKIELFCRDEDVDRVLHLVTTLGWTGRSGDGIAYVSSIDRTVKVRDGTEGVGAVDWIR